MRTPLIMLCVAALAPRASADPVNLDAWGSSTVEWFRGVDQSETQLRTAIERGYIVPADREATIRQIRWGAASLRVLLVATIPHDSMLAAPMAPAPPPAPPQSQWGNRFIRASSIIAVSGSLANILASMHGVDVRTRQTLVYATGTIGCMGALYGLLRPRPNPAVDTGDKPYIIVREVLLRDTFAETSRRLRTLSDDLYAISIDPAVGDSATVGLVRRYSEALERASSLLDIQIPHATMMARMGSNYPKFSDDARGRLTLVADHLDHISAEWRTWRWLVGRSQRDALGFLAMAERP